VNVEFNTPIVVVHTTAGSRSVTPIPRQQNHL